MSEKKKRHVLRWILLIVFASLLGSGGLLYYLASRRPAAYQPVILTTPEEKAAARKSLENRVNTFFAVAEGIGDNGELSVESLSKMEGVEDLKVEEEIVVDPSTGATKKIVTTSFKMPMSQNEVNTWASAMASDASGELGTYRVKNPAFSFDSNGVKCFAEVGKVNKVVGVDVGVSFNEGMMTLNLNKAQVGDLPMPEEALDQNRQRIAAAAKKNVGKASSMAKDAVGGGVLGDLTAEVVKDLGPKVGDALEGKAVTLDLNQTSRDVQIRGIRTENGKVTLDVVSRSEMAMAGNDVAGMPENARTAAGSNADEATQADRDRARELAQSRQMP